MWPPWPLLIAALLLAAAPPPTTACTSLLVGGGATADGSLLLARSDDGSDAIRCEEAVGQRFAAVVGPPRASSSALVAVGMRLKRVAAPPVPAQLATDSQAAFLLSTPNSALASDRAVAPDDLAIRLRLKAVHHCPSPAQRHQQPGAAPRPLGARHLAVQPELPSGGLGWPLAVSMLWITLRLLFMLPVERAVAGRSGRWLAGGCTGWRGEEARRAPLHALQLRLGCCSGTTSCSYMC